MERSSALILLLAGAAGCRAGQAAPKRVAQFDTLPSGRVTVTSNEPIGWLDPTEAWQLVETNRIRGESGTPSELIQPRSLAVDGAGRLYVADQKPPVIKVFDSAGSFVRTIGREGSGPGEFRVSFIAARGGYLVVHDPMQSRTSVFDTAGTYVRSWTSSCCFWDNIYIDRAMRVYIPSMSQPDSAGQTHGRSYTRYTLEGELVDTLLIPDRRGERKEWVVRSKAKGSMMSTTVPFTPQLVNTFHPAGGFVYGWTDNYRLVRSPKGGPDSARILSRAWVADPLPDNVREARTNETLKWVTEQFGEATARDAIKLSDVPTVAPPFQGVRTDELDNIWVRRVIGSDSTKTTYDVFDAGGSWLGPLILPVGVEEFADQLFGERYGFAIIEDEEGNPAVLRFRIDRR